MNEIKTEIKENADGSFTITDAHSTADILRWLLTQDSSVRYLLDEIEPKREWVGLLDEDKHYLNEVLNLQGRFPIIEAIEAKLKEKNT